MDPNLAQRERFAALATRAPGYTSRVVNQPETDGTTGISTVRAGGIVIASATVALSTLLITMIAGQTLVVGDDPQPYKDFVVFWSFLFGVYGVVVGLQNEATRAVGAARRDADRRGRRDPGDPHRGAGVRILALGLVLGACVAAGCVLTSWWWGPRLMPATMPEIVFMVAFGVVAYAAYMTMLGSAAGYQRWHVFSALMMIDALGRLALVGGAALLGWGLIGFQAATILVSVLWLALPLLVAAARDPLTARGDAAWGPAVRKCVFAMISSTSTALLVVGFPVLMQLTGPNENPGIMAGTITAISLTRSPLMIPLLAFQGVAISTFLNSDANTMAALGKVSAIICAVGAALAVPAGLLGPWFLRTFYDPAIRADGYTFAGLMFAAVPLAVLTLTGTATLALDRHRWFALGWVVAAAAATVLLYLPMALPVRACVALFAGPIAGIVIHVWAIAGGKRAGATTPVREPSP